jgi:ribosome-associated protein
MAQWAGCKLREPKVTPGLAICQCNEDDQQESLFPLTEAPMADTIQVNASIAIPRSELVYRASRSGGAGGQHVNTSSTRIEVLWAFEGSSALTDSVKARIRSKLGARIDAEGLLRVVAGNRRSQLQNRGAAEERLAELVRGAMHVPKTRKRTKPTRASKEARISDKKRHSRIKGNRRTKDFD